MKIKFTRKEAIELQHDYLAKLRYQKTELSSREKSNVWIKEHFEKLAEGKEQEVHKWAVKELINQERIRAKVEELEQVVNDLIKNGLADTETIEIELKDSSAKIIIEEKLKSLKEDRRRLERFKYWLQREEEKGGKGTIEQEAGIRLTELEISEKEDLIKRINQGLKGEK